MCFDLLSIIKTGNSDLAFPVILTKSLRWHYPNQVNGSKVTPSSQPVYKLPVYSITNKNRRHPPDASCKNHRVMTSYGGITRIRLKGRSSSTSSQPAAQAPLYLFVGHIIHRWPILCNGSSAQNQMLILVNMPEPGIPGGPLQCPPAGLPGGGRGGQYCKCYKNWGNSRLICSQNDGKIEACICRRGICTKTKRRKQT